MTRDHVFRARKKHSNYTHTRPFAVVTTHTYFLAHQNSHQYNVPKQPCTVVKGTRSSLLVHVLSPINRASGGIICFCTSNSLSVSPISSQTYKHTQNARPIPNTFVYLYPVSMYLAHQQFPKKCFVYESIIFFLFKSLYP